MKLLIFSLLAGAASLASAQSQPSARPVQAPPSMDAAWDHRLDLARQFIQFELPGDSYFQTMRSAAQVTLASANSDASDPEAAAAYKEAQKGLERFFVLAAPVYAAHAADIREAYAQAYAREYAADELEQLLAFGRTPAGRHFLAEHDTVNDPAVSQAEWNLQNDLESVQYQLMKERCAEHTAQRIAAGDTKAKCPFAEAETGAG